MDEDRIKKLPDYPVLRQVQKALWKTGEVHGAAVMIGAGFSQFAVRAAETTPLAPLWSDFQKSMFDELYPAGGDQTDPIALADEYRAALGSAALENLIRSRVRDEEWTPGGVHRKLLSLPWSDVLTTNWDTLLERSVDANQELLYDVVRVPSDIARTHSPRIVKLHGSFPSYGPFIFSREDFRTYSTRFAPFVNLARQVLLENELCLLGFSGDDPNFLEWSGWVRDQLGDSARPIRLVGVLNLSYSRRRLLEKLNVTPIDLAPLVKDIQEEDRHFRAAEIFLEFLLKGCPRTNAEWELAPGQQYPQGDSDPLEQLRLLSEIWKSEREKHPGWLVTPYPLRERLQNNLSTYSFLLEQNLDKLPQMQMVSVLYERIWRGDIAFWPLAGRIEEVALETVMNENDRSLSLRKRLLIRVALVRAARRRRDWEAFEQRIRSLDSLNSSDAKVEALYERCLRARDDLDYGFIAVSAGSISGQDPVWLLRRAALIAELGDFTAAAELIYEAYREIRNRRAQDRSSLWLLSREAWMFLLVRSASLMEGRFSDIPADPSSDYRNARTNPYDELQEYENKINEISRGATQEAIEKHPRFDAGVYRFKVNLLSSFDSLGSTLTQPYQDLIIMGEHVGVPLRLGAMNILRPRITQALQVPRDRSVQNIWASIRALAVTNGFVLAGGDLEFVENRFSNASVACISHEELYHMVKRIMEAIAFGKDRLGSLGRNNSESEKNADWENRTGALIELLSRLSVRFQGNEALSLFRFGVSLVRDPNIKDASMFRRLDNLLRRSLQALEPERHGEVACEVLCLPLPSEKDISDREDEWPEVSGWLKPQAWEAVRSTPEGSSRIEVLIKTVADSSSERSRQNATLRLWFLFDAGVLTDEETEAFGSAFWNRLGSDGTPEDMSTPPYYFLELPSSDPDIPRKIFNAIVIKKLAHGSLEKDLLWAVFYAVLLSEKKQKDPYSLNPEDAISILDHVLAWQRPTLRSLLGPEPEEGDRTAVLIGFVLASAVLPSLSLELIGKDRVLKLLKIASDGQTPELVSALPALMELDQTISREATGVIRKGLIGQRAYAVKAALRAVSCFEKFARHGISSVPEILIVETVSKCQMRREPGLELALLCIRPFVEAGVISKSEQYRLVDALELLRVEARYENWLDENRHSDVLLLRKEALRLARALKDAGVENSVIEWWIEEGKSDPMPEVRYALS